MEYIIVQGNKEEFEKRINELSKEGYCPIGNMNTNYIEGLFEYSQLVVLIK